MKKMQAAQKLCNNKVTLLVCEYKEPPVSIHLLNNTCANVRLVLQHWTVTINLRGHVVCEHHTLLVERCKTDLAGCPIDSTTT